MLKPFNELHPEKMPHPNSKKGTRPWKDTWSMMEPPKSWSPINHVCDWILYPDWFPQHFRPKVHKLTFSWSIHHFVNDLNKNLIHPYNYPYVFLHLQLITYQVFFCNQLPFTWILTLGSIWMIQNQGFSPDGLYAATWLFHGSGKTFKCLW